MFSSLQEKFMPSYLYVDALVSFCLNQSFCL
jgi:hypothetical protein